MALIKMNLWQLTGRCGSFMAVCKSPCSRNGPTTPPWGPELWGTLIPKANMLLFIVWFDGVMDFICPLCPQRLCLSKTHLPGHPQPQNVQHHNWLARFKNKQTKKPHQTPASYDCTICAFCLCLQTRHLLQQAGPSRWWPSRSRTLPTWSNLVLRYV